MAHKLCLEDFKALVDRADDGYMIADADGVYLYTNKAYLQAVGIDRDVVGDRMQDYIDRGDIERFSMLMAIEEKKQVSLLSTVRGKQTIYATSKPIFDQDGNITKVFTHVKDVTESENLRKQVRTLENLGKGVQSQEASEYGNGTVVGSRKMQEVFDLANKVKDFLSSTIMLLGESGVGKDVVARYLHQYSALKKGPFIAVNCGALSEQLLETELFGYVGGSFTGANKAGKMGLFEAAQGGTLFLDEIGDVSPGLQVKLLRAIENRTITRVGDYREVPISTRILTATNKNLPNMIASGDFREDLYYRLNVVTITIPPLRERKDDIQPLLLFYLKLYNEMYNLNKSMSKDLLRTLNNYAWPGNVRELKNVVERLVVTSDNDIIGKCDLPRSREETTGEPISVSVNAIVPIEQAVSCVERKLLQKAWQELGTSRKIAEALEVDRSTISRKLLKYHIAVD